MSTFKLRDLGEKLRVGLDKISPGTTNINWNLENYNLKSNCVTGALTIMVKEVDSTQHFSRMKTVLLLSDLNVDMKRMHYNPDMMLIVESVAFADRKKDWKEVCIATGVESAIIMSSDVSHTRRLRARWTNIELPKEYTELTKGQSRRGPNTCMNQGRKLVTFEMEGHQTVRPIGASRNGDPGKHTANTGRPIEVIEEGEQGV